MAHSEIDIEEGSETRLLTCLNIAIDEAKWSRQSIQSSDISQFTQPEAYYNDRLQYLEREIEYLEAMQQRVKTKLERGTSVSG